MRNEHSLEWVRVGTLAELNALVGQYVTGEQPQVHWEDSHAHMRFESVQEGRKRCEIPISGSSFPRTSEPPRSSKEVLEFEPYSTVLTAAWQVVEKVATPRVPLRLWRDRDVWCAAFGEFPPVGARTA